jgi:DNA-binding GntR family transcriptional regulator
MDDILKYASLLALSGTAISFIVGLIKWIDQRNREQEQKTFEAFHKMVCRASGSDENKQTISMAEQIASIYQLQKYKQYAFASLPVMELLKFEFDKMENRKSDDRSAHLRKAIDSTIAVLSKSL